MVNKNIATKILNTFQENNQKVFLKDYLSKKKYNGSQAFSIIHQIAKGLIAEGCREQESIAIYSQNCPEWTMVDLACMLIRAVSVPIYATNNSKQTDYILNDANVNLLFVGSQEQYHHILNIERKDKFRLIIFDENVKLKTEKSIYFKDWVKSNYTKDYTTELENRKEKIKIEDLVTLIYTSGTTGKPKGVKFSHLQFNALVDNHNMVYDFKSKYNSIAFLPLSHVFERGWTFIVLSNGMTNIYLSDPKLVADAIADIKPYTFCAVPRLYEKIYAKIKDEIHSQSIFKQKIFYWAINQGNLIETYKQDKKSIPLILSLKYKLADRLVFSKIKSKLGGNLVLCPCGGAYIPDELVKFFRAIGVPLLVGYGLTETTATVTSFTNTHYKIGTVGKPIINVDIKIGDYNEILVKGDTVTSGYYQLEDESKENFTSDGWFKTGDAGHIDKDGYLVITDRIKQLIKTANGKYISPQLVEGRLAQSSFISQAMVVGEGKPYASALITLDQEPVEKWAKKKNIQYSNFKDLIENNTLVDAVNKSINKKQSILSDYEKVKKIKILPTEFTMEKDELTPTLKLKRKVILSNYSREINELYS